METLIEFGRITVFVVVALILPQAMGYLVWRATLAKGRQAASLSILIPPVFFFIAANLFWAHAAQGIRQQGLRVCGAFGAAAGISTVFGTLVHLAGAGLAFFTLCWLKSRKVKRLSHSNIL